VGVPPWDGGRGRRGHASGVGRVSDNLHGPATHSETGGDLWHYAWGSWMWCEREGEAFDWPEESVACPHCGEHVEVPL